MCVFIGMMSTAQNLFLYLDHTSTQPAKNWSAQGIKNTYYATQWVGFGLGNNLGIFAQGSQEPSVKTLTAGMYWGQSHGLKNSSYFEVGLCPGLEWNEGQPVAPSISGYLWFETHPEDLRLRGKWLIQVSPYYSKEFGLWCQGFGLYSPTKWLSVGAYFQTDNIIGPRLQFNLPGGLSLWGSYGLQKRNSESKSIVLGIQFLNNWNLKKKR